MTKCPLSAPEDAQAADSDHSAQLADFAIEMSSV